MERGAYLNSAVPLVAPVLFIVRWWSGAHLNGSHVYDGLSIYTLCTEYKKRMVSGKGKREGRVLNNIKIAGRWVEVMAADGRVDNAMLSDIVWCF